MENIALNSRLWDGLYDWKGRGEEWSDSWGNSRAQWLGSIYPRIGGFLPCSSILEIAPGFGRWTQFLLGFCKRYVGVDLSKECVDACKERFLTVKHASFYQNDGSSLCVAEDQSVDFVFSFDSLVHASKDVIERYVYEIMRVLKPSGAAFIHHSNWAMVDPNIENLHGRGFDVSGVAVIDMVNEAGGGVLIQERIDWGRPALTDCLTIIQPQKAEPIIVLNKSFMEEASHIKRGIAPYSMLRR